LEGQLGTLRDVIYGIYPYTTSSCTLAAHAAAGSGCFSQQKPLITGVMKAFSTCVGEGPFVTELQGALANEIREVAEEYGAATGRPRRIGYFDVVASRHGAKTQAATELAITKLDSLSGRKALKICTHYRIGPKKTDRFPLNAELVKAGPVYADVPGWTEDITSVRRFEDLPKAARDYVETIEKMVGVAPIRYVSVGPERDALIVRK
jgi:adenylosuccinate synthase